MAGCIASQPAGWCSLGKSMSPHSAGTCSAKNLQFASCLRSSVCAPELALPDPRRVWSDLSVNLLLCSSSWDGRTLHHLIRDGPSSSTQREFLISVVTHKGCSFPLKSLQSRSSWVASHSGQNFFTFGTMNFSCSEFLRKSVRFAATLYLKKNLICVLFFKH